MYSPTGFLRGVIKNYDWGSSTLIQDFAGIDYPRIAEVWFGAHPSAPSEVLYPGLEPIKLHDDIAHQNEDFELDRGDLPFLVKLLAADRSLSVQVHPDKCQAEHGFLAENQGGIPIGSSERNYKDANHKPEVIVALTEFRALSGLRTPKDCIKTLELCGSQQFEYYISLLRDGNIFDVLADMVRATNNLYDYMMFFKDELSVIDDDNIQVFYECAEQHPGDSRALVVLLMNYVVLQPGNSMFTPPGVLHAYLSGLGVEVMSSSDNVVRAGLTSKHVDVEELLSLVNTDTDYNSPLVSDSVNSLMTSVDSKYDDVDFMVQSIHVDDYTTVLVEGGYGIVLCTEGVVDTDLGVIHPGEALWFSNTSDAGYVLHMDNTDESDGEVIVVS